MEKFLFLIVTVFNICSCTSKPDGYEVTIDLKNAKNEQIYVSERIPHPTTWYTDTIQLKDGKAVIQGKSYRSALGGFCSGEGRWRIAGVFRNVLG